MGLLELFLYELRKTVASKALLAIIILCLGISIASVSYTHLKQKAIGFLVGQTMKAMKGKANPTAVNEILAKLLNE